MVTQDEWRKTGDRLSNWGRWGADDQLGTLNFITAETVKHAATLVKQGKIFPLGIDFNAYGPQGAHADQRLGDVLDLQQGCGHRYCTSLDQRPYCLTSAESMLALVMTWLGQKACAGTFLPSTTRSLT